MEVLADGSILVAFRLTGTPIFTMTSSDGGLNWSNLTDTKMGGVWPRLLRMSSGQLVLASGRVQNQWGWPMLGLYVSANGTGTYWTRYDVVQEHNTRVAPSERYSNTTKDALLSCTGYSGITEVEPGVVLLAYDCLINIAPPRYPRGQAGEVWSMRITI